MMIEIKKLTLLIELNGHKIGIVYADNHFVTELVQSSIMKTNMAESVCGERRGEESLCVSLCRGVCRECLSVGAYLCLLVSLFEREKILQRVY